jgi:hypothetical protein
MDPRSAPAWTGALATLGVLVAGSVAQAATTISLRGHTSQGRGISLKLGGSAVSDLQYHIDDRCPDGRVLFVHNWGFPALPVKNSRFGGTFVAKAPEKAKAVVAGRVSGNTVSGTLSDRSRNNKTRKFCTGKATFKLTRKRPRATGSFAKVPAGPLPRLRALAPGITMPLANERPSGPKNTSKFRRSWIPEST